MKRTTLLFLIGFSICGVSSASADQAPESMVRLNQQPLQRTLYPSEAGISFDDLREATVLYRYFASEEEEDFFELPGEFGEKKKGLKSKTTAALLSFILPGAGEIYGGSESKGKIFIFSEASLWAGFFAFRTYGAWLENDFKVYAASRAKVDLEGKSGDFFDQLAFYDSRDQYNQFAPLYHRGEKAPYPANDFWNWEWDSRAARDQYRDLKNRSKSASRRAVYMVGLSIVNRIVSVVDAMKTVQAYNRKKSLEFSHVKFDLKANPLGHNPQIMVYISRKW